MSAALATTAEDRWAAAAERVRTTHDIALPPLSYFNSEPCRDHHEDPGYPVVGCRSCGFVLRRHQRVAALWLFLVRKGLLADQVGLGKTNSAAAALALAAEAGELDPSRGGGRALVVCRPAALDQWRQELSRALPRLVTEIADGSRRARSERYAEPWQILLIGYHMLQRDVEVLERLNIRHLIVDDVDPIRHSETRTAWAVKRIALQCSRVMVLSGTPLQKRLEELYDLFTLFGGARVFGTKSQFKNRYVVAEPVTIRTRGGVQRTLSVVSHHRKLAEFKELAAPLALRRTAADVEDIELPAVVPENVFLDLHRAQRERYAELASGVVRLVRESGVEDIKRFGRAKALAKILYGSQICEGLAALGAPDGPGASVKLDWLMTQITGDWSGETEDDPGEKVVVFAQFKAGVRALAGRLQRAGIGHVVYWGEDASRVRRAAAVARFWDDPTCRVLVGTQAIEQSLNLHISRRIVNVDQLMNPARMNQLAGRVRRFGSAFETVYVHNLLTVNTHEERILALLESEAALAGEIWGESDPIYAPLTPIQILEAIAPDSVRGA